MMFIYPMAVMVFYIFGLGVYNFRTRSAGVRKGAVKVDYFKILDGSTFSAPERMVRVGRHYDNQFELPMLFLVTCLTCMQLTLGHIVLLVAAWGFVLSRFIHTYIHLGSNNVMHRAQAFAFGWLCIITMWITIVIARVIFN